MIDWFPTSLTADPATGLARWQGLIALRRTARAIDSLDPCTTGHSERVAEVAADIAAELGWIRRRVDDLRDAGHVHDVGKSCVPESVLLSPRALTPTEFEIVKAHAGVGADAVAPVLTRRQAGWIRHHHERWDGRGYPDGLIEHEIPDGAAILCLADSWDAMTHRSWSGEPLTTDGALEECRAESGRQFAPWAVAALERVLAARASGRSPSARPVPRLRLVSAA
ncbi:HD-GYP domain-containing protein [Miltoncostaea oceani]|jgi:HD-GYP domain-containing protein (c-di-GMP phosphodiesterase class II)|uniref:HD-GYP domain-containing protein n=1 Tax=Miltoncostaea oceani TaxID=2843216 RepID=UPI001C3DCF91|nr:HD domain-containing phosphohydrolase [Miltoncostaea oceani]